MKEEAEPGTSIFVTQLNDLASNIFATKSAVKELRKRVSRHFALILDRGFRISIKGPGIKQKDANLTSAGAFFELKKSDSLLPFIAAGEVNKVKFEIYAGFIANPARSQDEASNSDSDDKVRSGWTIACNDRIVLWRDRSVLTSWGVKPVGNYHSQYNSIAGLVLLTEAPEDLPLTTTKAGVDLFHPLYQKLLKAMADATSQLTSFTNKVKKDRDGYSEIIEQAVTLSVADLRQISTEIVEDEENSEALPGFPQAHVQAVKLPEIEVPKKSKLTNISYKAEPEDFAIVSEYLEVKSTKVVGKRTFDMVLEAAKDDE